MTVRAKDIFDSIRTLRKEGMKPGYMLGLVKIDPFYSIRPGNTTTLTAFPGSGKSFFVLNILVCLTKKHGLKHFIYTPEMGEPAEVYALLIEIITGMRFQQGHANSITSAMLEDTLPFVDEYFRVYDCETSPTMTEILQVVEKEAKDSKIKTFSIDNYNDLKHSDVKMIDLYTEDQIVQFNRTAKRTNTHGFLTAHPRNLMPGTNATIPRPDEIKGGSAWWSKGQTIIGMHREATTINLRTWKVKPRVVGDRGEMFLGVDFAHSTYYEVDDLGNKVYLFPQEGREEDPF